MHDVSAFKIENNLRSPTFFPVFLQSQASQWYASLPALWNKWTAAVPKIHHSLCSIKQLQNSLSRCFEDDQTVPSLTNMKYVPTKLKKHQKPPNDKAIISHQPRCANLEVHPHCLPLLSQIPPWVKIHQNKLSKKRERKFVIQQQKKRTLWESVCGQTVVYNPSLAARQAFQVLQAILLCWHRVP